MSETAVAEQKYGLKETKEVLVFAFKAVETYKLAKADGKIDMNDAGLAFTLFPSLTPAFENITLVPKEIKDLDASEIEELETYLMGEIGKVISKEKLLTQINAGLKLIHAGYEFYVTLKD